MSNRAERRARMKQGQYGVARSEVDVAPIDPRAFKQRQEPGNPRMLNFESMLSVADGTPLIKMQWGNESGQMTVEEARAHALHVLEVAEAAEYDAAYHRFLTEEMGLDDPEKAAYMVGLLREHRGKIRGFTWKTNDRTERNET